MKILLPSRPYRIGIDQSFAEPVLLDALNDLALFKVAIDPERESIIDKWLSKYKTDQLFQLYVRRLTAKMKGLNKQKAITASVKETKKGGEFENSNVYCLHTFYRKKRKKIRRTIIREGKWKKIIR